MSRTGNVRYLAVRLLERLAKPGCHLDEISRASEFLTLSPRDRKLLIEIAYGVERRRGTLDFLIGHHSRRPLGKLDERVLWILRVGLYQIEYLRVPERAAVHEAVESCRRLGKSSASTFVNALLRKVLRQPPPRPGGSGPDALAARHSHPQWLVRRYLDRLGPEKAEAMLESNNRPPTVCLRVVPGRLSLQRFARILSQEGIAHRPHPTLPNCLILKNKGLSTHRLYRSGHCFFMDAGSQRIAERLQLGGQRRIGDLCAAPGSKAFVMSERMDDSATLHCCDLSLARLREAGRRAKLHQVSGLTYAVVDWSRPGPFQASLDRALVDVPCSGLGTLRSNPDIRWKFQEADLLRMSARQGAILENAFDSLRPGGQLLYATCSTEPEENEEVVEAFLRRRPTARRMDEDLFQFCADREGDAFYSALLHKTT